jgi:hypothetical protein
MPAFSKPLVEVFGSLNLPLGGTNGYVGVRKAKKGGFQGYTPKKTKGHFTGRCETAQEAAVARAIKIRDIELGLDCDDGERSRPGIGRRLRLRPGAASHASRARASHIFWSNLACGADTSTQPKASRKALKFHPTFDSPLTGIPQLCAAPRVSPLAQPMPARPLTVEQSALLLALGAKHVRAQPLA